MSIRKVAAKTRTFCGEIVILVEFDNEVYNDEYMGVKTIVKMMEMTRF